MSQMTKHNNVSSNYGMLPAIISREAAYGNDEKVMAWLQSGGDVNATDLENKTLVFLASENGHLQLLWKLLRHPEVNVNKEGNSEFIDRRVSPLGISISKGHPECAEAILSLQWKCPVKRTNNNTPLICVAANKYYWGVVEKMLPLQGILETCIMDDAIRCKKVDVIRKIIDQVTSDYSSMDMNLLNNHKYVTLYKEGMWQESGVESYYESSVHRNNDSVKEVLREVAMKKDWEKLEFLLKMSVKQVFIRSDLADAIFDWKTETVKKVLMETNLGEDIMVGVLLLAAIGGTSEEIAEELLEEKRNYSTKVLEECLILACLYGRTELVPRLFKRESFGYGTLCRARNVTRGFNGHHICKLLDRAMMKCAKEFIPLENEEEEDPIHLTSNALLQYKTKMSAIFTDHNNTDRNT